MINDRKEKKSFEFEKYLFFVALLVVPIIQFLIFYVAVNFRSVFMSFQRYEEGKYVWNGIENFKELFQGFSIDPKLRYALINSIWQYLFTLLLLPVTIIVSYYLYIKIPFSGVFKVVLMVPQMISGMIFVSTFRILLEESIVPLFNLPIAVMRVAPTQFVILMLYGIFFGLGGNMVLYLGSMSAVDKSLMEYGQIDGLTTFGRFIHIVLPAIYPTIVVFLVASFAGFFTNQGATFSFFDIYAQDESYTLGYWLFVRVYGAKTQFEYPLASAAGLVFTLVATPVTLFGKYLLEKLGPRED